jgi:hypothetical protein
MKTWWFIILTLIQVLKFFLSSLKVHNDSKLLIRFKN